MKKIELDQQKWDAFVSSTTQSEVLQSYEWGEVKGNYGWQPIRIAIEDDNKIVASALILKRKLPYINKSIFYIPRGPILDFEDEKALEYLLEEIRQQAQRHKAILLKIDPEIDESDNKKIGILEKKGFKIQKKQVQPRATIFLDLRKPLEEILKNCEEKTRYNTRLSFKKGVKVREASNETGLDIFYDIYKETAGRDNFLIHPKKYYQKVYDFLIKKGLANIFIAEMNSEPLAAVWIFNFGKRIWYMYGASKSSARNVMPNHALHFEVMKWAKGKGFELYDLWGIPANPKPNHPLFGVYRFKKGYNGELEKFVGAMDLVYDPIFYFLFEKGLTFVKNMRSLITKGKIEDSLGE